MDDYLKELIQDTPSSRTKLLAAWDGLTGETQIKILHALAPQSIYSFYSLPREMAFKALESGNEYVRYLGARGYYSHAETDGDNDFVELIVADQSPLVRSVQDEYHSDLGQLDEYFRLPKVRQLAKLRGPHPPPGDNFAIMIQWAIENRRSDEDNLRDLVREYVRNPKITDALTWKPPPTDFSSASRQWKEFEALWKLVPQCPEEVASCLVIHLPAKTSSREEVPPEVLGQLKGELLALFLSREDVEYEAFREEVFYSTDEGYDELDRMAACDVHFGLGSHKFDSLLKTRPELLKLLTHAPNLHLVYLECMKDHYRSIEDDVHADAAEESFDSRIERYKQDISDYESSELRVYRLAKKVVPWNGVRKDLGTLPRALAFLEQKAVAGDTWATYMAFEDQLMGSSRWKEIERHLPTIYELKSDAELWGDKADEGDVSQVQSLADSMEKLKQEVTTLSNAATRTHQYVVAILIGVFILLLIMIL